MGMIFIVSSTGILVYKTHCSCTGTEQVGIYLKPETCETEIHTHNNHDEFGKENESTENCCHECSPQNHDCGCASPEVRLFKLTNHLTQDEISFDRAPNLKVTDIILTAIFCFSESTDNTETDSSYTYPPPNLKSSKDFLIRINQLKIPLAA